MASKADLDNHSNQLNPNNVEYSNSRGWDRDEEDEGFTNIGERHNRGGASIFNHPEEFTQGFRLAVVSLTGRALYIAFRTSHRSFLKIINPAQSAIIRNEDFAELLHNEIARQLSQLWRERLATFVLYNQDGRQVVGRSVYKFPAALSRDERELRLWNEHGKAAVQKAHKTMSVPADCEVPNIQDWGVISDIPATEWTSLSPGLMHLVTKLINAHPEKNLCVV